jgi:hypothetical protein
MSICKPEIFGSSPLNVMWKVVRGDTAVFKVKFFEPDEETPINISSWSFESTAFDPRNQSFQELEVSLEDGYVVITADADLTQSWGLGVSSQVAELTFDLEVNIGVDTVWTPIIGTISVIGDVTGGRL